METPTPVNLNNPALTALLAKAKNVMKKVESTNPITLSESTIKQAEIESMNEPEVTGPIQPRAAAGYTREQVMASSMPPAVKEAMLKSIPVSAPIYNENDEVDEAKMIHNKRKPITKQIVTEHRSQSPINSNSDMLTISRTELKEMINESLIQFLTQSYNKTLSEDAIKKTINMLIKEGKLSIKQKTI